MCVSMVIVALSYEIEYPVFTECPGGAEFPCNDNGICQNGINGTGMCQCNPGYNGTACEYKDFNGTLKAWGKTMYLWY